MNVRSKNILVVEPGYPHRKGHVCLPGGMLNFASRLIIAGAHVRVCDLNLAELPKSFDEYDCVMISIFAKPYLAGASRIAHAIRKSGFIGKIIVGGQGVEKLPAGLLERMIPEGVEVWDARHLRLTREDVGMQDAFKLMPDSQVLAYIEREFGIYVSDGCQFGCNFCDAHCGQAERYRDLDIARDEFTDICMRLKVAGKKDVHLYLSNLDGFQRADKLLVHLEMLHTVAESFGIEVHARCLSTAHSFVSACKRDQDLLTKLVRCGLKIVAFGADGADSRVWQRENKRHNSIEQLERAYKLCRGAGIMAEALMVIGFHEDDIKALGYALMYSLKWATHGVVIRPYLGKPTASTLTQDQVDRVVYDPQLILNLDYAMCGSDLTHPRVWQRWAADAVYLGLIVALTPLKLNTTFPLVPRSSNRIADWVAKWVNRLMPADR